jgi:hypothetical protein
MNANKIKTNGNEKEIKSLDDALKFFKEASKEKSDYVNHVINLGYCIDALKVLYHKGIIETTKGLPKIKEEILKYDEKELEKFHKELNENYFPNFKDIYADLEYFSVCGCGVR